MNVTTVQVTLYHIYSSYNHTFISVPVTLLKRLYFLRNLLFLSLQSFKNLGMTNRMIF